jgi:hypothetical protein
MPDGHALGLVKYASYLLGTWRTESGMLWRFLRIIEPYQSSGGCYIFSTRDGRGLEYQETPEAQTYKGGIETRCADTGVTFAPPGGGDFLHYIDRDYAVWREGGALSVEGTLAARSTQWYNPWRDGGGGLAVTTKFRASGTVFDEQVDGFFAHEVHYFPPGRNFLDSPYGFGGREVHWGHMATAFDDGTSIDASLAYGPDGWGFALLFDETGRLHKSTDIKIEAEVRTNGYPERIRYRFLDQSWIWQIEPHGERAALGGVGIVGAEGILRREGDTRRPKAAMGTIDWWLDGRALKVTVEHV